MAGPNDAGVPKEKKENPREGRAQKPAADGVCLWNQKAVKDSSKDKKKEADRPVTKERLTELKKNLKTLIQSLKTEKGKPEREKIARQVCDANLKPEWMKDPKPNADASKKASPETPVLQSRKPDFPWEKPQRVENMKADRQQNTRHGFADAAGQYTEKDASQFRDQIASSMKLLRKSPDVTTAIAGISVERALGRNKSQSEDRVRRLQELFGVEKTGKWDANLIKDIARWQHAAGLGVDGVLGDQTLDSFGGFLLESLEGRYADQTGRRVIPIEATGQQKYDFLKQLVIDRGGTFKDANSEVNIVAIRGLKGGVQVDNKTRVHDDTLFLVGKDADGKVFVKTFDGSTDPGGRNPNKPTAHVRDGSYFYKVGRHKHSDRPTPRRRTEELRDYLRVLSRSRDAGDRAKAATLSVSADLKYTALVQKSPITVLRDQNRDHIHQPTEEDKGYFGINMHMSGIKKNPPWSIGCQTISGDTPQDMIKNYIEFISTIQSSTNSRNLPFTIIDATKVDQMVLKK